MIFDISFIVAVHMLTGSAVVLSGAMALLFTKGSSQHKVAGRLFVASMVLMGPVVAAGAWLSPGSISALGIFFVFFIVYLVVSGWSTIHRSEPGIGLLDIVAPFAAICIYIAGLMMGFSALGDEIGEDGLPLSRAYFFFSALAFLAMILDVHNIFIGGVRGKHRIIRHVWRLSCGLFFAVSSLFTGPGAIVFPESIRANPLLSVPQILVVLISIFWICRLSFTKQRVLSSEIEKETLKEDL